VTYFSSVQFCHFVCAFSCADRSVAVCTGSTAYCAPEQCMRLNGRCGMTSLLHFHQELSRNTIDTSPTKSPWIYFTMKMQYARKISKLLRTVFTGRQLSLLCRCPVLAIAEAFVCVCVCVCVCLFVSLSVNCSCICSSKFGLHAHQQTHRWQAIRRSDGAVHSICLSYSACVFM